MWGYYYTNLKGLRKVNGEWSLIMTVYNMKRCLNILGFEDLMLKLKNWKPKYSRKWLKAAFLDFKRAILATPENFIRLISGISCRGQKAPDLFWS